MTILETERLVIRELVIADAAFILELLNEPAFIEFIGNKGVRDLGSAETYLRDGPLASYAKHGFGLWRVALKDGTPIGSCGLLQRDFLSHPDLGYAFLSRYHGRGYALEAATAVLAHARGPLRAEVLHAITAFRNPASIRLLGKLGFEFVDFIEQPGATEPSRLFVSNVPRAPSQSGPIL
jgi:ribosomal-protein-alanine N-acetyltransferase